MRCQQLSRKIKNQHVVNQANEVDCWWYISGFSTYCVSGGYYRITMVRNDVMEEKLTELKA